MLVKKSVTNTTSAPYTCRGDVQYSLA